MPEASYNNNVDLYGQDRCCYRGSSKLIRGTNYFEIRTALCFGALHSKANCLLSSPHILVSRDWLGKIKSPAPTEIGHSGARLKVETESNELTILSDVRQNYLLFGRNANLMLQMLHINWIYALIYPRVCHGVRLDWSSPHWLITTSTHLWVHPQYVPFSFCDIMQIGWKNCPQ